MFPCIFKNVINILKIGSKFNSVKPMTPKSNKNIGKFIYD